MRVRLLISPLTKGAWFDDALDVARAELGVCGFEAGDVVTIGGLSFIEIEAAQEALSSLARLSFVQGLFEVRGEELAPLDVAADFAWPEALVYGQKYAGKTNELVTQLAINAGLQSVSSKSARLSLLDPMAGRGTTLLWALRYGFDARGIEIDLKSTELFHANIKKQCKLARIKHRTESGRIGKTRKQGTFERFTFGEQKITMINGDSRDDAWTENRLFDLIVTDLPYGVQHKGDVRRSPLSVIEECAPGWSASLKDGGAMVLIFNNYQTSRADLAALFAAQGLETQGFAAAHRMSESIVRDLIVFKRA